jgi:hypothetical protein
MIAAMPNATTIVIAANKIFVFMAAATLRHMLLKICYELVFPILSLGLGQINGFELHKQIKKVDPSVKLCFLAA